MEYSLPNKNTIQKLQQAILTWYAHHARDLPWRRTADPYRILVSEVMLQQTQASRVIPKYEAWLKQFPTCESLAKARSAEVIRTWAGLGYNRRALYLQQTAKVLADMGTVLPRTCFLQKLPGVGPYTTAAILSFAYNEDVVLVDTNIKRFYQLITFGDRGEPSLKEVREVAEQCLPKGQSRAWHNALMDIGAILHESRGARAQQQKLVALFPILKTFDLPTLSHEPLKRPKQANYKTSRRYWRGKIIQLIGEQGTVKITGLRKVLEKRCGPIPYPADEIITDLVRDHLLISHGDKISLP